MSTQEQVSEPASADTYLDDNEAEPLTGKPFFHLRMLISHISQYHLVLPTKITRMLPSEKTVPVILIPGSRSWDMSYIGNSATHNRLDSKWRTFVGDNVIKVGDVCVFELMSCENTLVKFKVQILRGDFPPGLLEKEVGTHINPVGVNRF